MQDNIVKMAIIFKLIYRLNAIPIKILVAFSAEINKLILNFIWKCKGPRIGKKICKDLLQSHSNKDSVLLA